MENETAGSDPGDARLNRRLGAMLAAMGERPGKSLPTAFQDRANTKAAYRVFANENVSEDKILAGHFAASALRAQATEGPILVLQDTTEVSFKRAAPEKIGFTKTSCGRKTKEGRHTRHTLCGMLMHVSLAVTPDGLPLGLTPAKFWSRGKFRGTKALKRKVNPTRVPIERKESMRWLDNMRLSTELIGAPERCVHIGDRESDIHELFCLAQELGTRFLVRSCVDRPAEDGDTTIAQVMAEIEPGGTHLVRFRDARRPAAGSAPVGRLRLDDGAPADRQAETPRPSEPSDHPRPRDRPARGPGAAVVEADHQPRRQQPRSRCPQA